MRRSQGFTRAALIALGLLVLAPALEAVAAVDLGSTEAQSSGAVQ